MLQISLWSYRDVLANIKLVTFVSIADKCLKIFVTCDIKGVNTLSRMKKL